MMKTLLPVAGTIMGLLTMSVPLAGCESCDGGSSYLLPTEWIGVRFESQQDADSVRRALADFATQQRRRVYRPTDEPFFAEQNRQNPSSHYERYTHYNPPGRCTGWAITQIDHSPECMIVMVSDRSGAWTPDSLEAVRRVERVLANAARGKVAVLVRAKQEQGYPAQLTTREVDQPPSEQTPCEWQTQFEVDEAPTP
jgi:hypothetical protein